MINPDWIQPFQPEQLPIIDVEYGAGSWRERVRWKANPVSNTALPAQLVLLQEASETGLHPVLNCLSSFRFAWQGLAVIAPGSVLGGSMGWTETIEALAAAGATTAMVCSNLEQVLGAVKGFERSDLALRLTLVDSRIPWLPQVDRHRSPLLNSLFALPLSWAHCSCLAYQSHFTDTQTIDFFGQKGYSTMRLGEVKEGLSETEPAFRDADIVVFNLAAIRQSDCPLSPATSPAGLTVEEACTLARYAGLSDRLKLFIVFGEANFAPDPVIGQQAAAQLLWYFADGVAQRKQDDPTDPERFTRYIVDFGGHESSLTFRKSKLTERWWVEVPPIDAAQMPTLLACTLADYQKAAAGEMPDRLAYFLFRSS